MEFEILRKSRKSILEIIDRYSIAQLNEIPDGFNNNIAWNFAHLVVTQQLLCYNLSGLDMLVSDQMVARFRKGTAPQKVVSEEELKVYKKLFMESPTQLERDYKMGIFKKYQEYTTSLGVKIIDIDFAISFNNYHEGIHLGVILGIAKLI